MLGVVRKEGDKVTLYLQCAGMTTACVTRCSEPISECRQLPNTAQSVKGEWQTCHCGHSTSHHHKNSCDCSIVPMPDSHFRCQYRLKVVLAAPGFSHGTFFNGVHNQDAHHGPVSQLKYPLAESLKDQFDMSYMQHRIPPARFAMGKPWVMPLSRMSQPTLHLNH